LRDGAVGEIADTQTVVRANGIHFIPARVPTSMNRRAFLCQWAGAGAAATLAGCIADRPGAGGDDPDAEPEEQPVATDGGVSSPELVGTDVETHDDADEARDEAEVSFGDESVTVEGAISAPTPCHEAAVKSAEYSEADDEFRVTMTTEAADSDGFCAQVVTGIEYALEATFDGGTPIHVTVRHETPGGETTTVAEDSRR